MQRATAPATTNATSRSCRTLRKLASRSARIVMPIGAAWLMLPKLRSLSKKGSWRKFVKSKSKCRQWWNGSLKLSLSVLILAMLMQGCSTTKFVRVTEYKLPPLPTLMMQDCKPLTEYISGDIEQIAITHGHNVLDASTCRARHNALVKYLREKSEEQ